MVVVDGCRRCPFLLSRDPVRQNSQFSSIELVVGHFNPLSRRYQYISPYLQFPVVAEVAVLSVIAGV